MNGKGIKQAENVCCCHSSARCPAFLQGKIKRNAEKLCIRHNLVSGLSIKAEARDACGISVPARPRRFLFV
ncbi:hypothetical protein NBRC111894_2965 [Sporolactobacillus inulinus]|uniref:Uncharacterized protein n=1 Tax=Sporolactobacillus inulinus TaxID=2078 RepID=A0A4Y1ZEM7_9BACL|nr:hypothetical protein NBRC111894_2965 [Sporolactobacillus inulinus]